MPAGHGRRWRAASGSDGNKFIWPVSLVFNKEKQRRLGSGMSEDTSGRIFTVFSPAASKIEQCAVVVDINRVVAAIGSKYGAYIITYAVVDAREAPPGVSSLTLLW